MEPTNQTTINQSPTNEEVKRIGRLIKGLRIAAGLTQDDIVARANGDLKKNTIIAIEQGKYNAGIRQVSTFANAMGYEVTFQKL